MSLKLIADTSTGKRSYSRPSVERWKEITDLFLAGGLTLAEVSQKYGVSARAIQIHVAQRRVPSAAAPSLSTFTKLASSAAMFTKATHEACIEETKASAYSDAVALQAMIGQALAALATDAGIPATARLRACDQAAVALARTHALRRVILGMSKDADDMDRPLPEFIIREMTDQEVEAIRNQQALEEGPVTTAATLDIDDELPAPDDDYTVDED